MVSNQFYDVITKFLGLRPNFDENIGDLIDSGTLKVHSEFVKVWIYG